MRTSVDVEDGLIAEAMAATGLPMEATVEEALRRLVRSHRQQQAIEDLSGLGWDGDLGAMREDRDAEPR